MERAPAPAQLMRNTKTDDSLGQNVTKGVYQVKAETRLPRREESPSRLLAAKHDAHPIVGHDLVRANINGAVADRADADNVHLADHVEELGDNFVKAIPPDFLAVAAFKCFDPKFLIGVLGGDFQGPARFD